VQKLTRAFREQIADAFLSWYPKKWPPGWGFAERPRRRPLRSDILADLTCMARAHPGVRAELDTNQVFFRYETDGIELEGVYLGPFRVEFGATAHADTVPDYATKNEDGTHPLVECQYIESFLDAEALDPNPAHGDSDTTHPHVQSNHVCLGDGEHTFKAAVREARFCDALEIVDAVLHTYNRNGPYVHLDEWDGHRCDNCEDVVEEDELGSCDRCGYGLCYHCKVRCDGCDCWFHDGCIDGCPDCGESICNSCMYACEDEQLRCGGCSSPCDGCGSRFSDNDLEGGCCDDCRDEECGDCGKAFPPDELEDGLCSDCQKEECEECGHEAQADDLDEDGKCPNCSDDPEAVEGPSCRTCRKAFPAEKLYEMTCARCAAAEDSKIECEA
jgi:hypothetical protein